MNRTDQPTSVAVVARAFSMPVRTAACVALWLVVAIVASLPQIQDRLDRYINFPILLAAKHQLAPPTLHPKLKLFAIDDRTAAELGNPQLPLNTWTQILAGVVAKGPRLIVIDKMFAYAGNDPTTIAAFNELIKGSGVKVAVPAFVVPHQIAGRSELAPEHYYPIDAGAQKQLKAYGPDPRIQAVLSSGHAMNAGMGWAQSGFRTANGFLPHMVFADQANLTVDGRTLVAEGFTAPVDGDLRVHVNFLPPRLIYKSTKRLLQLIDRPGKPANFESINAGDVVLIQPGLYTGGVDFTETPLGPMPGAFVISSLLNSRLSNEWTSPVPGRVIVLIVACLSALLFIRWRFPISIAFGIATLVAVAKIVAYTQGYFAGLAVAPALIFGTTVSLVAIRAGLIERLALALQILRKKNHELQAEIDQAAEIARVFLPERPPKWPNLDVNVFHQPLHETGGDWYAFQSSPDGRLSHVLLCDITGHGVQAAIVVSTCRSILSSIEIDNPELLERHDFWAVYASKLNEILLRNGQHHHSTGMIGITIDRSTGHMYHLTAGMPDPVILRSAEDEGVARVIGRYPTLGLQEDMHVQTTRSELGVNDSILIYSDGILMPGSAKRIDRTIRHIITSHDPAVDIAKKLAEQKSSKAEPDDRCLIVLRWRGSRAEKDQGNQKASA